MYSLLIADDEMIERKVLARKLRARYGEECEILEAENGREVLQYHAEKNIEIMILDIEMPGITGLEAAEKIRESDPDCCIIFLTAFDEFSYARKAITVHALDYLLKPCDERELLLSVDAAMDHAERLRSTAGQRTGALGTEAAVPHSGARPGRAEKLGEAQPGRAEKPGEAQPERAEKLREEWNAAGGAIAQTAQAGWKEETESSAEKGEAAGSTENEETAFRGDIRKVIRQYIDEHYMEDLSVQELAGALHYSEAYFCKLFKQYFGKNFISYLSEYRVELARRQLSRVTVNIKEIGRAVGYQDSNYFAKVFKRVTGQSPSEYRAELLKKSRLDPRS